jgi:ethanolamine-phosphate phospho-lyase
MSQNNFTNSVAPSSILCAAFAGVVIGANIGTLKKAFARIFYSTVKHDSSKDHTLSLRSKYFCDAQSISYKNTEPLMALKASMQYIFDERGNRFLDTRNNVGHVGWQHPHVVSAIQEQVSLCNANTRYIHPKRTRLAERLLKYFPERLSVVFFVNSGSEANDLALRLAR